MNALPIERPGKIVCVGLNYRDHAEEQGVPLPEAPLLFAKWQNTLIGPGDPIVIPPIVTKCDYEAELGVVIGTKVRGAAAEVPDPQALGIRCVLNGETMQDSTTANMIFGVAEIIAYASATMTFEPGDLIATGTPAGVGVFRDPPVLLKEGDEVTIEIDGLGSLTNPVRVEPA